MKLHFLVSLSILVLFGGCAGPSVTPDQLAAADAGPMPGIAEQEKIKGFLVYKNQITDSSVIAYGTPKKEALNGRNKTDFGWSVPVTVDGKPWAFFFSQGYFDAYLSPENAPSSNWLSPMRADRVFEESKWEIDSYRKIATLNGPNSPGSLSASGNFYDFSSYCYLRAWPADNHDPELCQLYVSFSASDWSFLEEAHDKNGQSLSLTKIDRQVSSGIRETVGVNLTRAYLQSHRHTGIDLRIDGQRGWVKVLVSPTYVDGFLRALDLPPKPPAP